MEFVIKISNDFYVFFHNNEICLWKGLILDNSNLLFGKEKLNFTISEFSNFKFEYSKVFVSLYLKKNFYLCFATIKFEINATTNFDLKISKNNQSIMIDFDHLKIFDSKFAEIDQLCSRNGKYKVFLQLITFENELGWCYSDDVIVVTTASNSGHRMQMGQNLMPLMIPYNIPYDNFYQFLVYSN